MSLTREGIFAALERSAAIQADRLRAEAKARVIETGDFYHGTSAALVNSIQENGILPGLKISADAWAKKVGKSLNEYIQNTREPSVFLATGFEYAKYYARLSAEMHKSIPVVLKIEFPIEWFKHIVADELDSTGWRIPKIILPMFIKEVMEVT